MKNLEATQAKMALRELLKPGSEVVVRSGGECVELPSAAGELLAQILAHLAHGVRVAVLATAAELTTQQAAALLNVSRPYLVRLLRAGAIPHRKVGIHRRVAMADVLAYVERQEARSAEAVAELTELAQEHDLGY